MLQETMNLSRLESTLPKIKEFNKKLKGIPSALGNTILNKRYGMFSGFIKEKSTIDSVFDVYDDFNNIILVFNDFERCKIDIIELLGFISSFLEKGSLKIIVIANENEIINVQSIDKLEERYNFALSLHNTQNVTKASKNIMKIIKLL